MYLTRWYRTPDVEVPVDAKLGGDLGFVKFLGIPGDGGTLSITLAMRTADSDLRTALSDADRFDQACRMLPGARQFFGNGPHGADRRRAAHDRPAQPAARASWTTTARRRCSASTRWATATPPRTRSTGAGARSPRCRRCCSPTRPPSTQATLPPRAATYEAACEREIEPWFDASVQMDRMGADPSGKGFGRGGDDPAAKAMGALFAAAATDPILGRALARLMNLLDPPGGPHGRPRGPGPGQRGHGRPRRLPAAHHRRSARARSCSPPSLPSRPHDARSPSR